MKTKLGKEVITGDVVVLEKYAVKILDRNDDHFVPFFEGVIWLPSGRYSRRVDRFNLIGGNTYLIVETKQERMDALSGKYVASQSNKEELPFFVYGTLRHNLMNYGRSLGGKTIAELPATVSGELFHQNAMPILFETESSSRVRGEIMMIKPELYLQVLRTLDRLESYQEGSRYNNYNRKKVTALLEDGTTVEAWAYYCADSNGQRKKRATKISKGDYEQWAIKYAPSYMSYEWRDNNRRG